jgi:hypothetical protein
MLKGLIILIALQSLLGCSLDRHESGETALETLKAGETVYVCGCPMMCCNSISRMPGRCVCNFPLRPGTVSKILNRKVYVTVDGREKRFSLEK